MLRQSVCVVLGHVDHGKTSILDFVRGTLVVTKEAGAITQHVGASEISKQTIEKLCKKSIEQLKIKVDIPGLLFVDTPGHESFTSLRERGGSIADIAVLVIDINQGIQPQTIESIKILKQHKTPFIIAANKIDLLTGWVPPKNEYCFLQSINNQDKTTQIYLDEKLYNIVGKLYEYGFESERFDRIEDFTKQIAIIPVSAKTGEGMSELLLFLAGLSKKFLEKTLTTDLKGPGKGSILEIKEEKGLGITADIIIYDGTLKKGDTVIFGTLNGAKKTKIRALLKPKLAGETHKDKYNYYDEVHAAAGIKLFAPGLEDAIAGSPIMVISDEEFQTKEINDQINDVLFENDNEGIILKADTLGSLEALNKLLKSEKIEIRQTGIGKVNKKDILAAEASKLKNKYEGVVLAFNVNMLDDAKEHAKNSDIKVIETKVVYDLVDKYVKWRNEQKKKDQEDLVKNVPWPTKLKILEGHCFRDNNPAIFGVEVMVGKIKNKTRLINSDGTVVGQIKGMQLKKKSITEATKGMQFALSMSGVQFSKDLFETTELYPYINRKMADELKTKFEEELTNEEKEVLDKIANIISGNPFF